MRGRCLWSCLSPFVASVTPTLVGCPTSLTGKSQNQQTASSSHTGLVVLGFALSPVPLAIQGFGTFFLDPTVLFQLSPEAIPQATGTSTQQLLIPENTSLVGVVLYLQGLIVNNATGDAHFTGYTADAIR